MKRVTIINGVTDTSYLESEQELVKSLGGNKDTIQYEIFHVRDMDIKYCVGCWDCWVKTPGVCRHKDDMPGLLKSIINSDLCVFVSPVQMGFVNSNIKKVNDKMIPLIHPYIGIFGGECHHLKRYERYPKLGLVLLDITEQSQESHDIITQVYKRMAINLKTDLAFSVLSNGSMEEVEYEIKNL